MFAMFWVVVSPLVDLAGKTCILNPCKQRSFLENIKHASLRQKIHATYKMPPFGMPPKWKIFTTLLQQEYYFLTFHFCIFFLEALFFKKNGGNWLYFLFYLITGTCFMSSFSGSQWKKCMKRLNYDHNRNLIARILWNVLGKFSMVRTKSWNKILQQLQSNSILHKIMIRSWRR